MANPFVGGGKVQFTPDRVRPTTEPVLPDANDDVRNLALERDNLLADLLEQDAMLDALEAAVDDQIADMAIPVDGSTTEAVASICDGGTVITAECYKKAKEMLRVMPQVLMGVDPLQLVFAKDGKVIRKAGQIIANCPDFDPDQFNAAGLDQVAGQLEDFNTVLTGDSATTLDEFLKQQENQRVSIAEVQADAVANQKEWSSWILFWDIIWGKPRVKEERAPNLVDERPVQVSDLKWQAAIGTNPDGVPNVTKNGSGNRTAVDASNKRDDVIICWSDPFAFMKGNGDDRIKNKGIPSLNLGFLLPLSVGLVSIPAQIISPVLTFKRKILDKLKIFKKIPIVGKKILRLMKFIIGALFMPAVVINNISIDMSVWIAMKPNGTYAPDAGDVPEAPTFSIDLDDTRRVADEVNKGLPADDAVSTVQNIRPTPGGWIPPDCFNRAQAIVNAVHQDATL